MKRSPLLLLSPLARKTVRQIEAAADRLLKVSVEHDLDCEICATNVPGTTRQPCPFSDSLTHAWAETQRVGDALRIAGGETKRVFPAADVWKPRFYVADAIAEFLIEFSAPLGAEVRSQEEFELGAVSS